MSPISKSGQSFITACNCKLLLIVVIKLMFYFWEEFIAEVLMLFLLNLSDVAVKIHLYKMCIFMIYAPTKYHLPTSKDSHICHHQSASKIIFCAASILY
jgi:hypothetical protein